MYVVVQVAPLCVLHRHAHVGLSQEDLLRSACMSTNTHAHESTRMGKGGAAHAKHAHGRRMDRRAWEEDGQESMGGG